MQQVELHRHGQRRRQPVHVQLVGVVPFRLEEDLVTLRLRELDDLVLDRRAVPRSA